MEFCVTIKGLERCGSRSAPDSDCTEGDYTTPTKELTDTISHPGKRRCEETNF